MVFRTSFERSSFKKTTAAGLPCATLLVKAASTTKGKLFAILMWWAGKEPDYLFEYIAFTLVSINPRAANQPFVESPHSLNRHSLSITLTPLGARRLLHSRNSP